MAKLSDPVLETPIVGTPYFNEALSVASDPGNEKTILTDTAVPASTQRRIRRVYLITQVRGKAFVKIDSNVVGSILIEPGENNGVFAFSPPRPVVVGETITVTFNQYAGAPSTDIDCFLMAEDVSV